MGFPDFLIIGASRCGTSSLFINLLKHPQLRGPNLPLPQYPNQKECHFFDKKFNDPKYGLDWYKKRFQDPRNNIVFFEATPNYLFIPKVPELVFRYMPHAKFIVMLRNPVNRAWSHFYHWRRRADWNLDTLKQRDHEIIKKGIYWQQLERWFQFFKREQFLIIRSEDFFIDPKLIISQCFEFVGLSEYDFDEKSIMYWDPRREYLVSKRRYGTIPLTNAKWLRNFYVRHNKRLENLLGRDFGWDE